MFDWDDLRIFLAVARSGGLSGAARQLRVNHATVFRRVGGFEARLGVRLFDRHRAGYGLTAAGEEMLETARRVEDEIIALDRRVSGRDLRLTGELRVATTDTVMTALLPRHLAAFRRTFPGVTLELAVDSGFANLGRREADVAVRPTLQPPEDLIGRRIARLGFAVYAGPAYLQGGGEPDLARADLLQQGLLQGDWARYDWLGPDDSLAHTTVAKWLVRRVPPPRIIYRSNSLLALSTAAKAGLGLAVLPCFLADPEPGLRRMTPTLEDAEGALWLLTHGDLRRSARVRAFMDLMAERLGRESGKLEGTAGWDRHRKLAPSGA